MEIFDNGEKKEKGFFYISERGHILMYSLYSDYMAA